MASLQPPFYEESIRGLFNSICYKNPKPLTAYSPKFNEFVKSMFVKKKEERPLISNLIAYFTEQKIPYAIKTGLSPLDQQNLDEYKSGKVSAFDKKRMIEKNTIGITKDFSALKNRIMAGNQMLKNQVFGSERGRSEINFDS